MKKKIIIVLAALFLVVGGGTALLFADQSTVSAPITASVPTVNVAENGKSGEADSDNVEVQEGDQNAPDDGTSAED